MRSSCSNLLLLLFAQVAMLLCQENSFAPPGVDVFSFDYTWNPARPVISDTVVFQAIADRQPLGWNLTENSFRWYQQLPSSGFQLRHIGRRYMRNASETYFEGRYRLRILSQKPQQKRMEQQSDGDLMVDVVKYIGLQKQVDIALITNITVGANSSSRVLVCRFWGWPLIDSLQFQPGAGSICERQHFITAEEEPHVDLVITCSKLLPGTFSCYGRNVISASQLSCDMTGPPDLRSSSCYRPSLGEAEVAAVKSASIASRGVGEGNQRKKPPAQTVPTAESSMATNIHRLVLVQVSVAVATVTLVTKLMQYY